MPTTVVKLRKTYPFCNYIDGLSTIQIKNAIKLALEHKWVKQGREPARFATFLRDSELERPGNAFLVPTEGEYFSVYQEYRFKAAVESVKDSNFT